MNRVLAMIITVGVSACSHVPKDKVPDTYSKISVLQLTEAAYTKGCIDGQNIVSPKLTKGKRLKHCQTSAKKYMHSIKIILE